MSSGPHFLSSLLEADSSLYVLEDLRTGRVVASALEVAFDSEVRRRGLLGRTGLAPDAVLIIAPCNGVHTFFMQFAIDVAFVGRDGTVLKLYRDLNPWRMAFALRAFAALEFGAGAIERAGIAAGDRLTVSRYNPVTS